jgi:uncharacterized membrane protein YgdD (TMEM256/DUF423 family)
MTEPSSMCRWTVVAGALAGAFGVAFAAGAAHSDAALGSAASMLLAHAPLLLILGFGGAARLRFGTAGVWLAVAGLVLFAGDIGLRALIGGGLFPFAAPIGGTLLIVAWLAVGLGAVFARR